MSGSDYLDRLRLLDSCAVSDALDQLGLTQSVTGLRALTIRRRIVGEVMTVRLAAGTAPAGAPVRHLCTTAIEAAKVGGVIVVEQRTGVEAAGWGGILSNAAQVRGLSGVIVEGLARDIDEAIDLDFCVYGRGATARTARGRIHEAETGGPITVGEAIVETGDIVLADSSGCTFIKAEMLGKLVEAAENIAAREALMTKAVRSGQPVSQVMGAKYEHMLTGEPKND